MARCREQPQNPGKDLDVLMTPIKARLVGLVARLKGRVLAVQLDIDLVDGVLSAADDSRWRP